MVQKRCSPKATSIPTDISGQAIYGSNRKGLNCIRGISDRDGSAAVNFFSSQPALNYGYAEPKYAYQQKPTDPGLMATRAAIKDVMKFWLDMGCDGFRVDMAGSLCKMRSRI